MLNVFNQLRQLHHPKKICVPDESIILRSSTIRHDHLLQRCKIIQGRVAHILLISFKLQIEHHNSHISFLNLSKYKKTQTYSDAFILVYLPLNGKYFLILGRIPWPKESCYQCAEECTVHRCPFVNVDTVLS